MGSSPCRKTLCGLLVCLLFVSGLNAESCKRGCSKSDNGNLKYQPGNVYDYSFDSVITVAVTGTETDETNLKVMGHAKIYAEGNCDYTLQLEKVSVTAVKESLRKQFTQGIQNPVQFSMSSGELEPQICADNNDNQYSLNLKRAIISMLQTSDKAHVTDVFGVCPTVTSITGNIVSKVRNLNNCAHREQMTSGLIAGIVNDKSGVKSTPLLNGYYSMEQELDANVVKSVKLSEEYKFIGASPAQSDEAVSGVRAKVLTNLKLDKTSPKPAPALNNGRSVSVIFHQPHNVPSKNLETLKKVLENTINNVDGYVKADSASLFTELIRLMRSANADTLTDLSAVAHPNKELARKVYLDALFRTATSEAVQAIVRQIPKMKSDKEKQMAFLSFNLVEYVTKDALNQAAGLLNANAPKEAYLAVGNLVNKMCKHDSACDTNEVNAVSKKFVDSLKKCKPTTKKDEDRIVYVLKGIRNTHKIADAAVATLIQCAAPGNIARVRVAAIQAFTASSCNSDVQKKTLDILKEKNEDSELRIEAYLAAVSCPNANLASEIAEIVNKEEVNQVGGFITSHLRAIRDSTDPTREAQRYYLQNIRVTKKFPIDPKRFSFNSEISYALDTLGLGAAADYSLIYSQNGFLPRSGRLNVTSEIFGQNFNILELSMRQENIESLLEAHFGPQGYFRKHNVNQIIEDIKSGRHRRSISGDATNFAKKYKNFGSRMNNDPALDISLRFFGSEFFFLSMGDKLPSSVEDFRDILRSSMGKVKEQAKNFQHTMECHNLFMDSEFSYPTGIGFPLELSAQGFAATKLDFAVEIDLDSKSKYRLKIIPSVDVTVNAYIGVDGLVLNSGLRISSRMHSATGGDMHLELTTTVKGFNLDLDIPRENIELIQLKHNVEFVVAEQDKEIKAVPLKIKKKRASQEQCFDQLQKFGVTVFYKADYPESKAASTDLLLMGPIDLSLRLQLEKKINVKGTYTESPTQQTWELIYDTPGSKDQHTTKLTFDLGLKPDMFGRLSYAHKTAYLVLEGGVKNNDNEVSLYGLYQEDGRKMLYRVGFIKNGNEYRPVIEVESDGQKESDIAGYTTDGRIIKSAVSGDINRYSFENVRLIRPQADQVTVNGWVDLGKTSYNTELKLNLNKANYQIKSQVDINPESGNKVALFVGDEAKPTEQYGSSVFLLIKENDIKQDFVVQVGDVYINLGNEFKLQRNKDTKDVESTEFDNKFVVKKAEKLVFNGELDGKVTPKQTKFELEAKRLDKIVSVDFDLERNMKATGDMNLQFEAKLNKHFIDLKTKVDAKGNKYNVDSSLKTSWGTEASANGHVGQHITQSDLLIEMEGKIKLTHKDKDNKWILKVTNSADKQNSEFKLLRDNVELIAWTGELQRPIDKPNNGKLSLKIKDVVTTQGTYKINKNGKGDLILNINLKNVADKIKVESKFTILAPKCDIDTAVFLGAEKKFNYKTENIVDRVKFSSKNLLEYGAGTAEKLQLSMGGTTKGEWQQNGEINGDFQLALPNGRELDGKFHRKLNTNRGIMSGVFDASLNDKLPNGKTRTFTINNKAEKVNPKMKELSLNSVVVYTPFEGEAIDVKYSIKHLPKGHFKTIEVKVDVNKAEPLNFVLNVDEYCPKHAIFRINGNFADKVNGNINGKYDLGSIEENKPVTYEVQGNLNLPNTEFKKLQLVSNGKYVRPAEKGGNHEADVHFEQKMGANFAKFDAKVDGNRQKGSFKTNIETSHLKATSLDGNYNREIKDENSGLGHYQYAVNYQQEQNYLKSKLDVSVLDVNDFNVHYVHSSSNEKLKEVDFILKTKRSPEDETTTTNAKLTRDGQTFGINNIVYSGEFRKGVNLVATTPSKTMKLLTTMEVLGERKGKFVFDVENFVNYDIKNSGEIDLTNWEDFKIKADSEIKNQKYHLDIHSKPGSNGKGLVFDINSTEKGNILKGDLQYVIKQEKNKQYIEGQGQVMLGEKSSPASFKLMRQTYELSTDGEMGQKFTFNGSFGSQSTINIIKMTTKEFHAKFCKCDEKKDCANVELKTLIGYDASKPTELNHDVLAIIDLKSFGAPYEFNLKSTTNRQNLLKFEHNFEIRIIDKDNKVLYKLSAAITPLKNAVTIKLPQREIVLSAVTHVPEKFFGHYEHSVEFYFDKLNKPAEKTQLLLSGEVSGSENVAINAEGKAKFMHPQVRTLVISGHLDANKEQRVYNAEVVFDIFKNEQQKIIAGSHVALSPLNNAGYNATAQSYIKSAGLDFEYSLNGHAALNTKPMEYSAGAQLQTSNAAGMKANGFLYGSRDKFEAALNVLDTELISLNGHSNLGQKEAKLEGKIQIFRSKPLEISAEVKNSRFSLKMKRDGLVDASTELELGKEAKLNVVGSGKQLYNIRVALDAGHFLQSNYESNDEDVAAFLANVNHEIAQDTQSLREHMKDHFQKAKEDVERHEQLIKESIPDLSKLKQSYMKNINEILKELKNDIAEIKALLAEYKETYEAFQRHVEFILEKVTNAYTEISQYLRSLYEHVQKAMKDSIIPAWEQFSQRIVSIVQEFYTETVNILSSQLKKLLETLKHYENDLKSLGKPFMEIMKPFGEMVQELISSLSEEFEQIYKDLNEYLSKLPSFEEISKLIKEKLETLKAGEQFLEVLRNVFSQLEMTLPDGKQFLDTLYNYIEAKVLNKPVNDTEALGDLYTRFVNFLRSLWTVVAQQEIPEFSLQSVVPFAMEAASHIPTIISFRFSPINFMRNENWLEAANSVPVLKPFFDFSLKGHVADGQHYFTFDGKRMNFPGSCRYILAQDYVDNNFTVIANLKNGIMKSITVVDRDAFVEVTDTGSAKIDGKASELPIHSGNMHVWRTVHKIFIKSTYGVSVTCCPDLKVCHVDVDYFYSGKTRGLLGNGNAEPFDDYILPDGVVADDYATFGNGYGLGNCQPVAFEDTSSVESNELCTQYFGYQSTLSLGFLFKDPSIYREACNIATLKAGNNVVKKQEAACNIALAYATALQLSNIPVTLPFDCIKCNGSGEKPRVFAEEHAVKAPTNKADIVFVVDTNSDKNLLSGVITPSIVELTNQLKTRGMPDVQISVIAYNEKQKYPAFITSNNGKIMNFNGKLEDIQLDGPEQSVYPNYVMTLLENIYPQSDELAFSMAMLYPFRPSAAKSIIVVRSDALKLNIMKLARAAIYNSLSESRGILLQVVQPIAGLSLNGVQQQDIVGFNSRLVATTHSKDAKKRPQLKYDPNISIENVMENGGWVFDSQNADKLITPDLQKAYLNQFASSVAENLFRTEFTGNCKCITTDGIHGVDTCVGSKTINTTKKIKA